MKELCCLGLRTSLARLARTLYRPLMIGGLRLSSGKPSKVGACRFYGPPDFLEQCIQALNELKELDSSVYGQLTGRCPYVFFFHKSVVIDDRFNRFHSIPNGYLDWGGKGIVARYVYAVFIQEMIADRVLTSADALYLKHDAVRIRTQEWLKAHCFPDQLLKPFDELARESRQRRCFKNVHDI